MKSLGDMNAAEIAAAYNIAIRNLGQVDIQNIEKNPLPTKEDTPLIAYAKAAYRLDADAWSRAEEAEPEGVGEQREERGARRPARGALR